MNKLSLVLSLLLFQFSVFAQSKEVAVPLSPTKYLIETVPWFSINNLNLSPLELEGLAFPPFKTVSTIFNLGIKQRYIFPVHPNWKLSFGIGIAFSYYGFQMKNRLLEVSELLGGFNYNPVDGDEDIILTKTRTNSSYIQLPIGLRYQIINKPRFRLITLAEIDPSIHLGTTINMRVTQVASGFNALFPTLLEEPHGLKAPLDDYFSGYVKKYALNVFTGLGVEFKITDDFWIGQSYTFQYSLITRSDFIVKEYGVMLEMKLQFSLGTEK